MGLKVFSLLRNGARHLHAPKELPELSRAVGTLPEMFAGKAKGAIGDIVTFSQKAKEETKRIATDVRHTMVEAKHSRPIKVKINGKEYSLVQGNVKDGRIPVGNMLEIESHDQLQDFCKLRTSLYKATTIEEYNRLVNEIQKLPNSKLKTFLQKLYNQQFVRFKQPKTEIPKVLSKIFEKDFSIEESKEFLMYLEHYMTINDNKQFATRIFSFLCKHYGFNPKKINLIFEEGAGGSMTDFADILVIGCGKNCEHLTTTEKRIEYIRDIAHELRHAKQHQIAYNYDKDAYLDMLYLKARRSNSEYWKECLSISQSHGCGEAEAINTMKTKDGWRIDQTIMSEPVAIFRNVDERACQYLNEQLNYKIPERGNSYLEYLEQISEAEANEAGHGIEQALRLYLKKMF